MSEHQLYVKPNTYHGFRSALEDPDHYSLWENQKPWIARWIAKNAALIMCASWRCGGYSSLREQQDPVAEIIKELDSIAHTFGHFQLGWENGFSGGCSLKVGFGIRHVLAKNHRKPVKCIMIEDVEVNWPSSHRSPAQAIAAAATYTAVANFGSMLHHRFNEMMPVELMKAS